MGFYNKEILSKLYALRAGLSVVYNAVDKADRAVSESATKEIKFYNALKKEKDAHESRYNSRKYWVEDLDYRIKTLEADAKKKRKILFKALGIAALIATGTTILILVLDFIIRANSTSGQMPVWIYFFDFFVVFLCGIFFNKTLKGFELSGCFSCFKKKQLMKQKLIAEKTLKLYENQSPDKMKAIYDAKEKEFQKSMDASLAQFAILQMESEYARSVILPELKKEYSDLLYVQNWKYLDLIIYTFESQRADTIVGALAYIDTQKRLGQILDMIQVSQKELVKSINEMSKSVLTLEKGLGKEIGKLSQSLKNAEARLSYKMDSAYNRIIDNQTTLNNELKQKMREEAKKIVSSNNRLISVQGINNALLREANSNSEEIVRKLGIISDKLN